MSRVACGSVVLTTLVCAALTGCGAAPSGKAPGESKAVTPSGQGAGSTATSTGAAAEGPQAVTQSGKIIDFTSRAAVAGATVTAGDQTATTATDGTFALTLQKGDPFQLNVTANGYATLIVQQTSLSLDNDAGPTTIVPNATASLLTGILSGYDATLGVLSVAVMPTGACASEDGTTITVSPAGSAQVVYMSNGLPSMLLKAVRAGQFPSAVIYNVAPNAQLTVTATHATCTEVAFPFTQDGVDYTGMISTQAGEVTGFARIFLQ